MNKEKISSQEIIDLVATKASVSKRAAEEFLKVMISTLEESLLVGEAVKIKNFGTFKLQWNEPRKSVNVKTGEEIILDGYHKVTFTPETSLKELVNEPFAHLEPVRLDDESNATPTVKPEEEALDPLRIFTEQASEIKDLLSEIQALSPKKNAKVSVSPVKDYFDLEKELKDELKDDVADEAEQIISVEQSDIKVEAAQEEIVELVPDMPISEQLVSPIEEVMEEINVVQQIVEPITIPGAHAELESTPFLASAKPVGKSKSWIWISAIILFFVLVGVGLFLFYPPVNKTGNSVLAKLGNEVTYVKENMSMTDMANTMSNWFTPKPQKVIIPETVVIPKDTDAIDSIEIKEPVDSLKLLFDNPRVYEEFIASEQIKRGSRLTMMAKRYYGSKDFWVYIYEANKERIKNPDNIEMGTLIRIPKLDPRLIDASNPRCVKKALELHDLYVKKKF